MIYSDVAEEWLKYLTTNWESEGRGVIRMTKTFDKKKEKTVITEWILAGGVLVRQTKKESLEDMPFMTGVNLMIVDSGSQIILPKGVVPQRLINL